jgi:hypothetical protein
MAAQAVTEEITAAVEKILEKHGLTSGKVSTKYGDLYSFSITADVLTAGDNGVNLSSKEARNYELFASSYGLPAGLLGKVFSVNGSTYAFAGIETRRPKYPIYAKNLETGTMSFFQQGVTRFLVDAAV